MILRFVLFYLVILCLPLNYAFAWEDIDGDLTTVSEGGGYFKHQVDPEEAQRRTAMDAEYRDVFAEQSQQYCASQSRSSRTDYAACIKHVAETANNECASASGSFFQCAYNKLDRIRHDNIDGSYFDRRNKNSNQHFFDKSFTIGVPEEDSDQSEEESASQKPQRPKRRTASKTSSQHSNSQSTECPANTELVDGRCVAKKNEQDSMNSNHQWAHGDPEVTYDSALAQCSNIYKSTASCCNNPIGCMAESAGISNGAKVSSGLEFATQFAALFAASGAGSQSRACGALQSLGVFSSGVSVAAASQCMGRISECTTACEAIETQLRHEFKACLSSDSCKQSGHDVTYRRLIAKAQLKVTKCDQLTARAEVGMVQASQSAAGAMLANKCKKAAEATNTASTGFDNVDTGVFNANCNDPSNMSNPICQNNCQRPGAANDPMCRQILGLDSMGGGAGAYNPAADAASMSSDSSNAFGLNENLDENGAFEAARVESKANSTDAKSQSGGSVPYGVGGNSAAMGAGGGSGAKRGVASGNRGKILKGYASGGGYSARAGGARYSGGGSGFSGYGQGKSIVKRGSKKFNLADYLPGNKLDPRKRKIASVLGLRGAAANQIGRASENIFDKISNRFQSICLQKRLLDCDKVVRPMRNRGR